MNALKEIRDWVIVTALAAATFGAASARARDTNRSPGLRELIAAESDNSKAFLEANNRGLAFYSAGKPAEAEREFQTAWVLGEKIFPPKNPNLAVVTINLEEALFQQKKYPEAEAAGRRFLRLQEKNPRPYDTNVLQIRELLGIALEKVRKFDDAAQEFSNVVVAISQVYGPESRETLQVRNLQAVNLNAMGKYTEAAQEFAAILPIQERVLGKDDPETTQTRENLAQAEKNKGVPLDENAIQGLFYLSVLVAGTFGFGIPLVIKLNRKLRARNTGVRSFRWGYICALIGVVACGFAGLIVVGLLFDPVTSLPATLLVIGILVVLGISGIYAFLRKRWAVACGILTFGALLAWTGSFSKEADAIALIWVAGNFVYLGRRWREMAKEENGRYLDLVSTMDERPAPATKPPAVWRERLLAVLRHPEVHEPTVKFATAPKRGFLKTVGRMTLLTLAGIVLVGLVIWALVAASIQFKIKENYIEGFIVAVAVGSFVVMLVSIPRMQKTRLRAVQRNLGYSAIEQVEKAQYPPALYLRAFNFDARAAAIPLWQNFMGFFTWWWPASTPELDLAVLLHKRKVPMLAIGRPGEKEPPAGAARVYVEESHWKDFVKETVPLSSIIIWATGYTAGLRWELEHLVTNVSPRRLLLWPHVGLGRWSEKEQRADWARFLERFQGVFPKSLPESVAGFEYIGFEDDWTPRFFPNPRQQFSIWERFKLLPPRLFLREFLKECLA